MNNAIVVAAARLLLPQGFRSAIRGYHRATVLDHAMREVLRDPIRAVHTNEVMARLIYGWGNPWSAEEEFLRRMVEGMTRTKHDVLECGSGLSTLLLGSAARHAGMKVWSLEHQPAWRERVEAALRRYGLANVVTVLDAPLQSYGEYDWYNVPPILAEVRFGLAICDGPPMHTRGGRYGLIPVLGDHFTPGSVVLLDDAARPEEQATIARWQADTGRVARLNGCRKPYAEMIL